MTLRKPFLSNKLNERNDVGQPPDAGLSPHAGEQRGRVGRRCAQCCGQGGGEQACRCVIQHDSSALMFSSVLPCSRAVGFCPTYYLIWTCVLRCYFFGHSHPSSFFSFVELSQTRPSPTSRLTSPVSIRAVGAHGILHACAQVCAGQLVFILAAPGAQPRQVSPSSTVRLTPVATPASLAPPFTLLPHFSTHSQAALNQAFSRFRIISATITMFISAFFCGCTVAGGL